MANVRFLHNKSSWFDSKKGTNSKLESSKSITNKKGLGENFQDQNTTRPKLLHTSPSTQ